MKITRDQREAINDILIDAFQSPKYIIQSSAIMSVVELAPTALVDFNAKMTDVVARTVYTDKEHKKSAILMCDIMNADEIVRRIEAIK